MPLLRELGFMIGMAISVPGAQLDLLDLFQGVESLEDGAAHDEDIASLAQGGFWGLICLTPSIPLSFQVDTWGEVQKVGLFT